jgi:hypothetical protein
LRQKSKGGRHDNEDEHNRHSAGYCHPTRWVRRFIGDRVLLRVLPHCRLSRTRENSAHGQIPQAISPAAPLCAAIATAVPERSMLARGIPTPHSFRTKAITMSKLLVDVRTLDLHPPTPAPALPASAPVGLVDRVSLRLGLWLLLRSTASANRRADRATRSRLLETREGLEARERESLRRLYLAQPHF